MKVKFTVFYITFIRSLFWSDLKSVFVFLVCFGLAILNEFVIVLGTYMSGWLEGVNFLRSVFCWVHSWHLKIGHRTHLNWIITPKAFTILLFWRRLLLGESTPDFCSLREKLLWLGFVEIEGFLMWKLGIMQSVIIIWGVIVDDCNCWEHALETQIFLGISLRLKIILISLMIIRHLPLQFCIIYHIANVMVLSTKLNWISIRRSKAVEAWLCVLWNFVHRSALSIFVIVYSFWSKVSTGWYMYIAIILLNPLTLIINSRCVENLHWFKLICTIWFNFF